MSVYRKLQLENLELGKKYTFYAQNRTRIFTANFFGLTSTTLLLKNYTSEYEQDRFSCIRSMPRGIIDYVESEEFTVKINNFIE